MNAAAQIPEIDEQAAELDRLIARHQKARDIIYDRLCRKLQYRDRRIRELSKARNITLQFSLLPLNGTEGQNAP
jgi:hypothetical protein